MDEHTRQLVVKATGHHVSVEDVKEGRAFHADCTCGWHSTGNRDQVKKFIARHWDRMADRALWEAGAHGMSLEDYVGIPQQKERPESASMAR
jgi:hypothetical protein